MPTRSTAPPEDPVLVIPDFAQYGGDEVLSCIWGSNREQKIVKWSKRTTSTEEWKGFWVSHITMQGIFNSPVNGKHPQVSYVVEQESDQRHSILLKDIREWNEGFYKCDLIIGSWSLKSQGEHLKVQRKQLGFLSQYYLVS